MMFGPLVAFPLFGLDAWAVDEPSILGASSEIRRWGYISLVKANALQGVACQLVHCLKELVRAVVR
jgi:hypothetical protein